MKKIIACTLALLVFSYSYTQKHNLSLRLQKGVTYYQKFSTRINIHQTFNGQNMRVGNGIDCIIRYNVKEANDSIYELETSYDSIAMTMQMPQMEKNYSSSDTSDMVSSMLSKLKDQRFIVHMYKTGKIKSVANIGVLMDNILESMGVTQETKQQLKTQLQGAFGEKSFKGNFESIMNIYPDHTVAINDQWTITTQLESTMSATMRTTYQLKEVRNDEYVVEGISEIKTDDKETINPIAKVPMKFAMSGTNRSQYQISRQTGWIMKGKSNQTLSGTIEIADDTKTPGGKSIPMEIASETTISGK